MDWTIVRLSFLLSSSRWFNVPKTATTDERTKEGSRKRAEKSYKKERSIECKFTMFSPQEIFNIILDLWDSATTQKRTRKLNWKAWRWWWKIQSLFATASLFFIHWKFSLLSTDVESRLNNNSTKAHENIEDNPHRHRRRTGGKIYLKCYEWLTREISQREGERDCLLISDCFADSRERWALGEDWRTYSSPFNFNAV